MKPPADLHSRQAWHSWACAADPAHPEVVWLGAAGLHRGARGPDGRWSWVDLTARPAGDSLPLGQHAVVFEPGDPRALYVANEGGLFRSPDGGRSWRSLATGLAVAEVAHLADHAAWLLAGAGELGTLRYEGGEVWCPVGSGDPAVTAGGELVALGAGGLVVSADAGSTWTAVALPRVRGAVTALTAAGPDRLLAGTAEGELLQLERAGGAWTVTGLARPRGGRVAGVAADPARPGVAWAAWSTRPAGREGTSEEGGLGGRVWRSEDGGATWDDRGVGLPEVPVSAVAPDPERPGTVFAATDAGVWWSGDDGTGWRPLGGGLPNAPVLDLAVRGPERLLRAGLLGRGVWELPLDGHPGPAVATPALRSGRSPAPRPRPGGPWWECPDIKLEVPPRPRDAPVEPVEFEDDRWPGTAGLPDPGGRVDPGRPARVHVQVHHRGPGPLTGVRVRVLATPASLRPPDVPPGPWITGDADPPPGSPWLPVGPAAQLGDLQPGRSAVATFDWQVPTDLPRDICLLALATAARPRPLPPVPRASRPGGSGDRGSAVGAEERDRPQAGGGAGGAARPAGWGWEGAVRGCRRGVGGGADGWAGAAGAAGWGGQGGWAGGGAAGGAVAAGGGGAGAGGPGAGRAGRSGGGARGAGGAAGGRAGALAAGGGAGAGPGRADAAAAARTTALRAGFPAAAGRGRGGARRAHLGGGPLSGGQAPGSARSCISQAWSRTCQAIRRMA